MEARLAKKLGSSDPWTQQAFARYQQAEVETRIRAKAAKLAAESRRLRTAGIQVPELEVDELINYAWILALKTRPALPDNFAMILYFWRRMENHFKDKCRKAASARMRGLALDGGTDGAAEHAELHILSMEKFRRTQLDHENAEVMQAFRAYLTLHDPDLLPLFDLIVTKQIDKPREQAEQLRLPVKDIYQLRARLQLRAEQFGSSLKPKR